MLQVTPRVSFPMNDAPRRSKIIIASAGIGIMLLGVLTRYLRRRFVDFKSAVVNGEVSNVVWCGRCRCGRRTSVPRGSMRALQGPTAADRASMAHMGPQQLASLGLDSLDQVISYWEQALQRLRTGGSNSGNEILATSLEFLLVEGQRLRGAAHWRLLADGLPPLDEPQLADFTPSLADTESFVSAEGTSDVAVVADLEASQIPLLEQSALYLEALELLEKEGIPCRTYRADVVRCSSREDYLAKIHCIRLAFKRLTDQPDVLQWLIEAANHILGGFMLCAGKDPKDALNAYRELVAYLLDSSHCDQIAKELQYKGVVCPTVYDVVIDYVLLDAFDDLSSPPQSVVAVIQNRWLTAGFKETALSAAIWSLFKAKKGLLPFSHGFFSHYYALMEQIVPVLAWGFLGTDNDLKDMCKFFKDEVEALVCDMFDPSRSRYSSVDDLAQDILQNSQLHYDRLCQALAGALLPDSVPP
ncbi:mitoguardin-like isoform X1 [Dermacentor silvarum]|uniref:mitoguardin-like isoform X1 n=1 Tax=Dermacentor silvarum TaxID=543639 RepID=UPI001898167E|nr:mitoguardin-like isoform X1 [Dermacentor silvarum]XP_049516662.1 mitoguardin-like isoform X1 [Dermacentor silvarum]